jgi:hypothetical protein
MVTLYDPPYKQKISSYAVKFYDMEGKEIEIPERVMKSAYTEIDQAIYEWENDVEVGEWA